jgi:hypothetical protein
MSRWMGCSCGILRRHRRESSRYRSRLQIQFQTLHGLLGARAVWDEWVGARPPPSLVWSMIEYDNDSSWALWDPWVGQVSPSIKLSLVTVQGRHWNRSRSVRRVSRAKAFKPSAVISLLPLHWKWRPGWDRWVGQVPSRNHRSRQNAPSSER